MQLIYQGKTSRCHPNYTFPEGFNITHAENHWSNEAKCLEMIDKIILPNVKKQIKFLGLRKNQVWLLIADVFKGQWTPTVKKKEADLNEKRVPVPNNTTDHFKTLEFTVNRSGKAYLRKSTRN